MSFAIAIFSLVIILIVLAGLTEYRFVPALEVLSERWKLSPSVAGATLMAMGSSAPELAIAFISLFSGGGEHSELGLATIVGSALFNLLVIVGVSGLAASASIRAKVFLRDAFIYAFAVAALLWVFSDGVIHLYEASILVLSYLALVIWMITNDRKSNAKVAAFETNATKEVANEALSSWSTLGPQVFHPQKSPLIVFIISVIAIATLCHFLIESALVIAHGMNISPTIVALTILAGGTSVPDMLASYSVARKGEGEMAVANAVGSNSFDILVGLGLPWMVAILLSAGPIHVSQGDLWTSAVLLGLSLVVVSGLLLARRKNDTISAFLFLGSYVAYCGWVWLNQG